MVIYEYQFSFPRFQSQRTHQEGGSRTLRVSWPCNLAATVICLSQPRSLVSAQTCLQSFLLLYCLVFLSAESVLLWACCQALKRSLLWPFLDSSSFSPWPNCTISRNIETSHLNLLSFFCKSGGTRWVWTVRQGGLSSQTFLRKLHCHTPFPAQAPCPRLLSFLDSILLRRTASPPFSFASSLLSWRLPVCKALYPVPLRTVLPWTLLLITRKSRTSCVSSLTWCLVIGYASNEDVRLHTTLGNPWSPQLGCLQWEPGV